MEGILQIITGVARVLALMGGLLAAVFVAWSGIQWITSSGDPQKIAQARTSLIGALAGLVVVGIAFLIPEVVSELVIEPAGGVAVRGEHSFDCDGLLRRQLVVQRTANSPWKMQGVIAHIQANYRECVSTFWNPVVKRDNYTGAGHTLTPTPKGHCFDRDDAIVGDTGHSIGSVEVPASLVPGTNVVRTSSRDAGNNIIVYWKSVEDSEDGGPNLPSDGAVCWLYSDRVNSWSTGLFQH